MKILSAFLITFILSGCVKIYDFEISTSCEKIISNNPNESIVTTVAGNGLSGYKDGLSNEAQFSNLNDITIDKTGNIYASDESGIRKINTNGVVSTFLKITLNENEKYKYSKKIEIDNDNNIYLIYGHSIRKINQKGESIIFAGDPDVNGFSDGNGTNAKFYNISDIAIDQDGNIFVTDTGNYRIRKIDKSGAVSTVAGSGVSGLQDGSASSSTFQYPNNITIDSENNIFLIDNMDLRKISNGIVSTFKNKLIEPTNYNQSTFYTIDNKGNFYFTTGNIIKKMTPNGEISDFSGTGTGCIDGSASKAKFNSPSKIIYYNGFLYISDSDNNRIRKIKI